MLEFFSACSYISIYLVGIPIPERFFQSHHSATVSFWLVKFFSTDVNNPFLINKITESLPTSKVTTFLKISQNIYLQGTNISSF